MGAIFFVVLSYIPYTLPAHSASSPSTSTSTTPTSTTTTTTLRSNPNHAPNIRNTENKEKKKNNTEIINSIVLAAKGVQFWVRLVLVSDVSSLHFFFLSFCLTLSDLDPACLP